MYVSIIGDDIVTMNALVSSRFIQQYACQWEQLAALLDLQPYQIDNISENHKYNPNRAVDCCKMMLQQWLKSCLSPSWDKLETAVMKLSSSSGECATCTNYRFNLIYPYHIDCM